MSDYLLDSV